METYVVAILAIVVVAVVLLNRGRTAVRVRGPLGTEIGADSSIDGVAVETRHIRAGRDVSMDDGTGRGIRSKDVDAGRDIRFTVQDNKDNDPKG